METFVNNSQQNQPFTIKAARTDMANVARVLGRFDKRAAHSVSGLVDFAGIFNCMATLKRTPAEHSYIASEDAMMLSGITTWDNQELAALMVLIARGKVRNIQPSDAERESLEALSETLSYAKHEQQRH